MISNKRTTLEMANAGLGCLGKSADNEPVFVLVARDKFAARLVRAWADLVEAEMYESGDITVERTEKIERARREARDMALWHTHKLPD